MKAFQFSLQSVLEFRNDVEEEKKLTYQQSISNHKQATLILEELRAELERLNQYFKSSHHVNIIELQRFHHYRSQLETSIKQQVGVVFEKQQEMLAMHKELVLAKQNVQVLETLKEKQYGQYCKQVFDAENKQLDEFASIKYALN